MELNTNEIEGTCSALLDEPIVRHGSVDIQAAEDKINEIRNSENDVLVIIHVDKQDVNGCDFPCCIDAP